MNQQQFQPGETEFEQEHRTAYLIATYIQEKLTPAEQEELDNWVAASKENLLLFEELTDDNQLNKTLKWFHKLDVEKAKRRVHEKMNMNTKRPFWHSITPYMVAASILIIALAAWFYQQEKVTAPAITEKPSIAEPPPGGNKAILTLGDGRRIVLDSAANGSVLEDKLTTIIKRDSVLTYKSPANSNVASLVYNTITVPVSGKYQVVLSDGTAVWLNAASSLRYPAIFSGTDRKVELTGEGYFEVAKNEKMPFHVDASGTDITVLGTHFNVRSYYDEASLQTTLMEGKVKVTNNSGKAILNPGEQAWINNGSNTNNITVLKDVDMEKVTAWKDGLFIFRNDDIKDIMKALERWYNIKVVYKSNFSRHFSGTFGRGQPLMAILQYLQGTGEVHFALSGNILSVTP